MRVSLNRHPMMRRPIRRIFGLLLLRLMVTLATDHLHSTMPHVHIVSRVTHALPWGPDVTLVPVDPDSVRLNVTVCSDPAECYVCRSGKRVLICPPLQPDVD